MSMDKSWFLVAFMFILMIQSSLSLIKCKKHELKALYKFKQSITRDPMNSLSSWVGDDCCHWLGVACDNNTSNVIKLTRSNSSLVFSELSSALLELKFLSHLDLSNNDFNGSRIPEFIGSMTHLRYLNLSWAGFSGLIPPQLGNLTNLRHLDLSYATTSMPQKSIEWASGLSKLQTLDMSGIHMSQAYHTLQVLFRLPSLSALTLLSCSIQNTHLPELRITNTSNLHFLDLGGNNFEGPFPSFLKNMLSLQSLSLWLNHFSGSVPLWLGNMTSLKKLDLGHNQLNGSFLSLLPQLTKLKHVDLSNNRFQGTVTVLLPKLWSLKHLDLSVNKMSGLLPDMLGLLKEIEYLDISSNSFHGTISGIGNLSKLSYLNMNYNNLNFSSSTDWRTITQLQEFHVRSCEMNTVFPYWLRNQTQMVELDLSNTGISGDLPKWLWNLTNLQELHLSDNHLTGSLPRHIASDSCNLDWLELQSNMISGEIPPWLCHLKIANVINLSQNLLSGMIFDKQNNCSLLTTTTYLEVLDLSNNMLSGEIRIKNIGVIPPWLSPLASLEILSLRGNEFNGAISSQFCHIPQLKILDLSHNYLIGHIPPCLGSVPFDIQGSLGDVYIQESIKGTTQEFITIFQAHSMIDLSSNRLVGTIPAELTNISQLNELNLSNNHLTGRIPGDIGNLKMLESLDLSNNNLSGKIPQSLSDIPYISVLNLSNNDLHGPIPTGDQLQTLVDPSIYAGNDGLCGLPLPDKCTTPVSPPIPTNMDPDAEEEEEDPHEKMWFDIVVMSGVATGFWGVVGTLVFKKSWRHAYFRFVEETGDRIYVPVKVRVNRLKNRMRN